jgi:hypothetical protein
MGRVRGRVCGCLLLHALCGAFEERGISVPSRAQSHLCHILNSFSCKLFTNGVPNLPLSPAFLTRFLRLIIAPLLISQLVFFLFSFLFFVFCFFFLFLAILFVYSLLTRIVFSLMNFALLIKKKKVNHYLKLYMTFNYLTLLIEQLL